MQVRVQERVRGSTQGRGMQQRPAVQVSRHALEMNLALHCPRTQKVAASFLVWLVAMDATVQMWRKADAQERKRPLQVVQLLSAVPWALPPPPPLLVLAQYAPPVSAAASASSRSSLPPAESSSRSREVLRVF